MRGLLRLLTCVRNDNKIMKLHTSQSYTCRVQVPLIFAALGKWSFVLPHNFLKLSIDMRNGALYNSK